VLCLGGATGLTWEKIAFKDVVNSGKILMLPRLIFGNGKGKPLDSEQYILYLIRQNPILVQLTPLQNQSLESSLKLDQQEIEAFNYSKQFWLLPEKLSAIRIWILMRVCVLHYFHDKKRISVILCWT